VSNLSPIMQSLLMTLIGMGLVFLGIILLWGTMALLMALLSRKPDEEEQGEEAQEECASGSDTALKQQAAAIAAAVALAMASTSNAWVSSEPTENVSPWQAVLRAGRLNQRSQFFTRKQRG
jgi:Na+-transporting methylmalonyl-CoA/oxaloacetate decarboxylase gamma subunit